MLKYASAIISSRSWWLHFTLCISIWKRDAHHVGLANSSHPGIHHSIMTPSKMAGKKQTKQNKNKKKKKKRNIFRSLAIEVDNYMIIKSLFQIAKYHRCDALWDTRCPLFNSTNSIQSVISGDILLFAINLIRFLGNVWHLFVLHKHLTYVWRTRLCTVHKRERKLMTMNGEVYRRKNVNTSNFMSEVLMITIR